MAKIENTSNLPKKSLGLNNKILQSTRTAQSNDIDKQNREKLLKL